jgi:hypothetical protein
MQALPFLFSAAGGLTQGLDANAAGNANAAALGRQAQVAQAQGYADEQTQRRQARQIMGDQAAAAAQAGSMGGTTDKVISQSAINAELDALNIRYGGTMKASGLMAQAAAEKYAGRAALTQSGFLAGANLLKGYGAQKLAKQGIYPGYRTDS